MGNFIQILWELCVTLKCSVNVVNARFAEPEMLYDFPVSFEVWGFCGKHSELYFYKCVFLISSVLQFEPKESDWSTGGHLKVTGT